MTCEITPDQWIDYLDGALTAAEEAQIGAHLSACATCSDIFQDLMIADEQLSKAAEVLRQSFTWKRHSLEAARVLQRLTRLRALMTPMCGSCTTRRAMEVAARRSDALSLEEVHGANWTVFMGHLTDIIVLLCGDPAAELVWQAGSMA